MFKQSRFAATIAGLGVVAVAFAGLSAQPASAAAALPSLAQDDFGRTVTRGLPFGVPALPRATVIGQRKLRRAAKCRRATRLPVSRHRCALCPGVHKKRCAARFRGKKKSPKPITAAAISGTPSANNTGAPAGVSALAVSGKPSASNTGVPAGTALTRYNGNLVITTPGAVIDRLDIHGFVTIKAANVTIKRSIIRGAASNVKTGLLKITDAAAGNGFLIEDVTLVPEFPSVYLDGIKVNKSGTFRRINMSGTVDGFTMYGAGITLQNSYLHDFVTYASDPSQGGGPSHSDTIQVQSGSNVRITANTLQGAKNAAVMITQDAGATKDLWINSNWIDNGGCSVNYSSSGAYKTGMQANNNRFGRAQRNPGCALVHNPLKSDLKPTGNVWDDNGAPVAITKGT